MLHFHNHQILGDRANYFGSLQFQSLLSFTTLYKYVYMYGVDDNELNVETEKLEILFLNCFFLTK